MQSHLSSYFELTKPRITFMVLITTALGFFLGSKGNFNFPLFIYTIFGTALSCAGACVMNQYLERDVDQLMIRTHNRPLPKGDILPNNALIFGILLVLSGTLFLAYKVNLLTGFLSLLTTFLYVLVYTPLKKTTWLNTFIGAIPGALPPMGGWTAATHEIELGAWVLFLILFVWQHPHFYAIAWMYKEDYKRAGFKMLPVVEPDGLSTFRQVLIYSIILIPVSLLPSLIGMSGTLYAVGSFVLSIVMLAYGIILFRKKTISDARMVLRVSIIYLPLIFALILIDVKI